MGIKKGNVFVLIITLGFLIISLLSLIDNLSYLITRKKTKAQLIQMEKLASSKPYKVYLLYNNEYEKAIQKTYIKDIDQLYGSKLKLLDRKEIYYRKYFPTEVYFVDYKSPNYGYLILSIIYFTIMLLGTILLIKQDVNKFSFSTHDSDGN